MYLIQSLSREKRVVKTIGNLSQNVNDLQPFYMRIQKYPFLILNFWFLVHLIFLFRSTFQQEVAKSFSFREKPRKKQN